MFGDQDLEGGEVMEKGRQLALRMSTRDLDGRSSGESRAIDEGYETESGYLRDDDEYPENEGEGKERSQRAGNERIDRDEPDGVFLDAMRVAEVLEDVMGEEGRGKSSPCKKALAFALAFAGVSLFTLLGAALDSMAESRGGAMDASGMMAMYSYLNNSNSTLL